MSRHGGKKLPLDSIKEALKDGRVWLSMGVVRLFDGETAHWEMIDGDILVDVELAPNGEPVFCRLGLGTMGCVIPPVGAEVIVAIPAGDLEANPVILAYMGIPDGVSETIMIIQAPPGGQVKIHDGDSGEAVALVKKSEFDNHTHPGTTLACTGGTVSGATGGAAAVTGTTVLKGK